jgi:hypothetical protein
VTRHTQRHLASIRRRDGHTIDGIPGDCVRACVATILNEPLDAVLHYAQYGARWFDVMRLDARTEHELDWAYYELDDLLELPPENQPVGWCILTGPSPRGPFNHAVVGTGSGRIVHDPHPSRAGLEQVVDAIVLVRPYDPAPVLRQLTVGTPR